MSIDFFNNNRKRSSSHYSRKNHAASFSDIFRDECIKGSAIAPIFLDSTEGTVQFVSDTAIDAGGSCVDEISDALNWGRRQAGFGRRESLEGAALVNEDGSTWQVALSRDIEPRGFGEPPSSKRSKRTPTGNRSRLFLPVIPPEIRRKIGERYDVSISETGSFWDWVADHPEIPVTVTEGGKKALSLLTQGYVAIALYGVNAGYQAKDPETGFDLVHRRLIPDLLRFLHKNRLVVLAFDQDDSAKTRRKVAIALSRFGKLLTAQKCKVDVAIWEACEGKGIDDAIVKAGADVEAWLKVTIDGASSFEQLQKDEYKARMLQLVLKLNSTQVNPERETQGEFLPELPALAPGQIHLVQCGKGGGKSTEISRIVRAKKSGFTIIFVPNNALGQQIAQSAGLPHIHSHNKKDTEDVVRFWRLVKERRGIVLCLDSVGALMDCYSILDEVDLIVFDEVNQTLGNIAQGGTTGDEQARVLESLAGLLKMVIDHGGAVLAAEAVIYQRSVEYLKVLCGTAKVRLFSHQRSEFDSWDVELFEGSSSGFVGKLFLALEEGKKIMLMVSSQIMAEKLHRHFERVLPSIKIIRLDSKTNDRGAFKEFYDDPDTELQRQKPDLLICSPSVKSGVSIERYPFDEVWGIFTSLHPDLWAQMTHRYRVPVPRKLFIKPFVQPSGHERMCSVKGIQQRLQTNQNGFAKAHGINLESLINSDDATRLLEIEQANSAFLSEEFTAVGMQKTIAKDYFTRLLEDDGHNTTESDCPKDPSITEDLALIHEEIEREKGSLIADIEQESVDEKGQPTARLRTLQDKYAKPDKRDKSAEPKPHLPTWIKQLLPLKLQRIEQAPGVNFDDPETCYRHLTKDYGRQWRGVELQALSEDFDIAQSLEKEDVEFILTGRLKLPHKLPRKAMQAKLIELCGVSALLDGVQYSNEDPRAIAIKAAALKWHKEIWNWLGLTINESQAEPDQTPVAICNKLLRKLTLDPESIARPGSTGEKRDRIYAIPGLHDPYRNALLNAMRRKLRGFDEESVRDSLDMLRAADGDPETIALVWEAIATLPEGDRNEIQARQAQERQRAAA